MKRVDEQLNLELFFLKYKYISAEELKINLEKTLDYLSTKIIGAAQGAISKQKRLALYKEIQKELNDVFNTTYTTAVDEIEDMSLAYATASASLIDRNFESKILDEIFNLKNDEFLGYTFKDAFKAIRKKAYKNIKRKISAGLEDGANPSTWFSSLKKDITQLSTAQIKTAARTYSKVIREEITAKNEDLILEDDNFIGWQSLSTLDSRTSPICIKLDKKYYSKKEYKKRENIPDLPPRHFNCRSVLVRVYKDIKPEFRQQNGDNKNEGLADNRTTFNSFLKRNPKTAEKILGKRRFNLYKTGKYKITDFINSNGEFYTLRELKNILNIKQ